MKITISAILIASITLILSCKKRKLADDLCDCANSKSSMVIDTLYFRLPTIFTPNGDGCNDIWFTSWHFPNSKFKIFKDNLFKKNLYEFNGTTISWDGNDKDGKNLPDGKYLYELTIKDQKTTGSICIYRGGIQPKNKSCLQKCTTPQPLLIDAVLQ